MGLEPLTTCAYASVNGHVLNINPLIPEGHGRLGGRQFINLGKLPNHWTDRDQIRHAYTDSQVNGRRLNKLTSRDPMAIWRGKDAKQYYYSGIVIYMY